MIMPRLPIVILGLAAGFVAGSRPDAHANFSVIPSTSPASPADRNGLKNNAFPVVNGFGTAIPLAFALRQIVPSGILVACNARIARHTIVTWRGGVPWNIALRHTLAPTGLSVSITPVLVRITLDPGPEK
jgi:hypothetical protein